MKQTWLVMCVLLTACSLAPKAEIPTGDVPQAWRNGEVQKDAKPVAWADFGSKELDALIAQALKNNTDIAGALARVKEAEANTKVAGGALYPQLDANGNAGHDYGDTARGGTSRSVGLSVSYELDIWRKNADATKSAELQQKASMYDREAVELLVSSEVARLYSGELSLKEQQRVAENNLKNAEDVLRITEARYAAGAISGLEQAQQRNAVEVTRASVASIKNNVDLFHDQLAQMVGVAPSGLTLNAASALDDFTVPQVAVGDPWSLLARRPDIAESEASLRAANIDIGVARAQALPSLSAAIDGTLAGNPSSSVLSLAGSFFAPIFHGGALEGNIERSEAVRDERVASYRATLLTSFREVEDALSNLEAANLRRDAYAKAQVEAEKAYRISRAQFDAGAIDFTTLLNTQSSLFTAQNSYVSARQDQLAAAIDLVRALGGTFDH